MSSPASTSNLRDARNYYQYHHQHQSSKSGPLVPFPSPQARKVTQGRESRLATALGKETQKVTQRKESREKGLRRGDEMYAPFNVAFDTKLRYFEWLEKEENAFRLTRFGKAMTGTSGWEGPGSVISGTFSGCMRGFCGVRC